MHKGNGRKTPEIGIAMSFYTASVESVRRWRRLLLRQELHFPVKPAGRGVIVAGAA